jgi:hypothetical protein
LRIPPWITLQLTSIALQFIVKLCSLYPFSAGSAVAGTSIQSGSTTAAAATATATATTVVFRD